MIRFYDLTIEQIELLSQAFNQLKDALLLPSEIEFKDFLDVVCNEVFIPKGKLWPTT